MFNAHVQQQKIFQSLLWEHTTVLDKTIAMIMGENLRIFKMNLLGPLDQSILWRCPFMVTDDGWNLNIGHDIHIVHQWTLAYIVCLALEMYIVVLNELVHEAHIEFWCAVDCKFTLITLGIRIYILSIVCWSCFYTNYLFKCMKFGGASN